MRVSIAFFLAVLCATPVVHAQQRLPGYDITLHRQATMLDATTVAIWGPPGKVLSWTPLHVLHNSALYVELDVLMWGGWDPNPAAVGSTLRLHSIFYPSPWNENAVIPPGGFVQVQPATPLTLKGINGAFDNDAWISTCTAVDDPGGSGYLVPNCPPGPRPIFVFLIATVRITTYQNGAGG